MTDMNKKTKTEEQLEEWKKRYPDFNFHFKDNRLIKDSKLVIEKKKKDEG